jgi:hypothetical protein
VPQLWLALTLAAVSIAAGVVRTVCVETLCQASAANGYRGRVFGALETTTALAMLVGMVFGSVLGDTVGVVPLFHVTAGLWLLAGLLAGPTLRGATLPRDAGLPVPRPTPAVSPTDDGDRSSAIDRWRGAPLRAGAGTPAALAAPG